MGFIFEKGHEQVSECVKPFAVAEVDHLVQKLLNVLGTLLVLIRKKRQFYLTICQNNKLLIQSYNVLIPSLNLN